MATRVTLLIHRRTGVLDSPPQRPRVLRWKAAQLRLLELFYASLAATGVRAAV